MTSPTTAPATSFTDYKNCVWNLALNVSRIRRLKQELQVNLLNLHQDTDLLQQLEEDPIFLVDVISVLLTDSLKEASIDAEAFAERLVENGECRPVHDAVNALVEAVAVFSPPEKARAIRTVWTKTQDLTRTTRTHLATQAEERFDEIETLTLNKMTQALDSQIESFRTSGSSLTNGVESSESLTPDRSLSVSSTTGSEDYSNSTGA